MIVLQAWMASLLLLYFELEHEVSGSVGVILGFRWELSSELHIWEFSLKI